MFACLLIAGGEVDPYTRCHRFWISKKDIKAEGVFLQVFSLNVAKVRLGTDKGASIIMSEDDNVKTDHFPGSEDPRSHDLNEMARVHILTPIKEMMPVDLPGGGLEAEQGITQSGNETVLMKKRYEDVLLKRALCQEAKGLGVAGFNCRFGSRGNGGQLSCWCLHRLLSFFGLRLCRFCGWS